MAILLRQQIFFQLVGDGLSIIFTLNFNTLPYSAYQIAGGSVQNWGSMRPSSVSPSQSSEGYTLTYDAGSGIITLTFDAPISNGELRNIVLTCDFS